MAGNIIGPSKSQIETVDANVDAIKVVTDAIPDAGAMTSIAQESTLGTPTGADISTDIANLAVDILDIKGLVPSTDYSGTYAYLDAGAEQTIKEITATTRYTINGIFLDLVNITQDGHIKLYYKVDGTNYREFADYSFTVATDSDGVYIDLNMGMTEDFKITYTEDADEGADRDIPYSIVLDIRE